MWTSNAITRATVRRIGARIDNLVDAGLIGPPAVRAGTTRLYLSGADARGWRSGSKAGPGALQGPDARDARRAIGEWQVGLVEWREAAFLLDQPSPGTALVAAGRHGAAPIERARFDTGGLLPRLSQALAVAAVDPRMLEEREGSRANLISSRVCV